MIISYLKDRRVVAYTKVTSIIMYISIAFSLSINILRVIHNDAQGMTLILDCRPAEGGLGFRLFVKSELLARTGFITRNMISKSFISSATDADIQVQWLRRGLGKHPMTQCLPV